MAYETIDLEPLLAPILDNGAGVGEDLRSGADPESLYLTLKDWRAEARVAEREASAAEDADSPPLGAGLRHWNEILDLAQRVLTGASKDLEVAGWLTEALVRTSGFNGLASGLELLARLIEDYWEAGLYPVEDEDGVEARLAPLFGLLGRGMVGALVQPVKLLPLSNRQDLDTAALWLLESAQAAPPRSEDPETRDRLQARQAEQLDALNQAVAGSSPEFLREVHGGAVASLAMLERLMDAIDARTDVGRFSSQIGEPLRAVVALLEARAGHLFVQQHEDADVEAGEVGAAPAGAGAGERGAPSGRSEAFNTIMQIADFFERTEPQSIVARSLRDVVRRARLPLPELLAELLPNAEQRNQFLLRAGIRDDSGTTDNGY
ncbi:MAG: type VI secretion system protein TssA [Caulobacteraceae bacterium]